MLKLLSIEGWAVSRIRISVQLLNFSTYPPPKARQVLNELSDGLRIGAEKTANLFKLEEFRDYVEELFRVGGLFGAMDLQGAWCFTLFPSTNRNQRGFTLSIGPHEVAFSERPDRENPEAPVWHAIICDALASSSPQAIEWLQGKMGNMQSASYTSAREGALAVSFYATFHEARDFVTTPIMRRAIIAYWHDWLLDLEYRGKKSVFARFHSYEAARQLRDFHQVRRQMLFGNFPID